MLGVFTGQMLAGLISSAYSWEYFYYICGAVWFLLLALHVAFVQVMYLPRREVHQSWEFMQVVAPQLASSQILLHSI